MNRGSGRFASIDIGTVTCRLLVADVDESGLSERARGYRITNLGEGVDASGVLKPQAMERVAAAVDEFAATIAAWTDESHPIHTVCVATSAARDAENADEFAALLARRGVRLSVIPGQREAALSFRGASRALADGTSMLMVDVGGGSTEVVAGVAGGCPEATCSFDVGCRRVTEKFFASDPPTDDQMSAASAWIRCMMAPYFDELRARGYAEARIVAVAGTATSVVSIRDCMRVYDAFAVDGSFVSRADLAAVHDRLRSMTCEQRCGVAGLDPGRAPVIVAGTLILMSIVDLANADGFTVSESDILHGIILDAADARLHC